MSTYLQLLMVFFVAYAQITSGMSNNDNKRMVLSRSDKKSKTLLVRGSLPWCAKKLLNEFYDNKTNLSDSTIKIINNEIFYKKNCKNHYRHEVYDYAFNKALKRLRKSDDAEEKDIIKQLAVNTELHKNYWKNLFNAWGPVGVFGGIFIANSLGYDVSWLKSVLKRK
jgi:hypothetical protein